MYNDIVPIDTIRTEPETLTQPTQPRSDPDSSLFLEKSKYVPPNNGRLRIYPQRFYDKHTILYRDFENPDILKELIEDLDSYAAVCDSDNLIPPKFKELVKNNIDLCKNRLLQNTQNERAFLTGLEKTHEETHRLNELKFRFSEQEKSLTQYRTDNKSNDSNRRLLHTARELLDGTIPYDECLSMLSELDIPNSDYSYFISTWYTYFHIFLESEGDKREQIFDRISNGSLTLLDDHSVSFLMLLTENPDILDHVNNKKISFDEFNRTLDTNLEAMLLNPTEYFKDLDVKNLRNKVFFKLAEKVDSVNKIIDELI